MRDGKDSSADRREIHMDLRHLRRETRTALELAVVALAPSDLMDRLAVVAGLLEALVELPGDSAAVAAFVPGVAGRGRIALDEWHKWHKDHLEKRIPRG